MTYYELGQKITNTLRKRHALICAQAEKDLAYHKQKVISLQKITELDKLHASLEGSRESVWREQYGKKHTGDK